MIFLKTKGRFISHRPNNENKHFLFLYLSVNMCILQQRGGSADDTITAALSVKATIMRDTHYKKRGCLFRQASLSSWL